MKIKTKAPTPQANDPLAKIKTQIKSVFDFLEDGSRWTQSLLMARNEEGKEVTPRDPKAVKWCLVGVEIICDIDQPAKIAIHNAAVKLFAKTKTEVEDGFELPLQEGETRPSIKKKDRIAQCHQNVLTLLRDAFTNPQVDKILPDPERPKEIKQIADKKQIEIAFNAHIGPAEIAINGEGVLDWHDGPIMWYNNQNPEFILLCQIIDVAENNGYKIHATVADMPLIEKLVQNEIPARDVWDRPKNRYWAITTDANFMVQSALELTNKPVPKHWLPELEFFNK